MRGLRKNRDGLTIHRTQNEPIDIDRLVLLKDANGLDRYGLPGLHAHGFILLDRVAVIDDTQIAHTE